MFNSLFDFTKITIILQIINLYISFIPQHFPKGTYCGAGRQVLHKSLMSSYNVCLLHGCHSIGHNLLFRSLIQNLCEFMINFVRIKKS